MVCGEHLSGGAGTSAGAISSHSHNGFLKVDPHLCGTGEIPVLGDGSGLMSIPLWQLLRRWHMSYSPVLLQNKELMGKFKHSTEHMQHGLGMRIVGQSRQASPAVLVSGFSPQSAKI